MAKEIMCNCFEMYECEEALPTRDAFVKELKKIDANSDQWSELFICEYCGQHWMIEKHAEIDRRANKAFKIDDPEKWLKFDKIGPLADWLIRRHGGLSDKQCMFKGCKEKALNELVFCVRHGNTEYDWS